MKINQAVQEYRELTERERLIKGRKKELADFIKTYAQKEGVQDDKGSYYCEDDNYTWGSQARKSVKLNFERARNYFISKGMWEDVVEYEEKINEEKVSELLNNEKMTLEDLEAMTDVKVTYAIDVREKEKAEDMPEVEVVSNKPKIRKIGVKK